MKSDVAAYLQYAREQAELELAASCAPKRGTNPLWLVATASPFVAIGSCSVMVGLEDGGDWLGAPLLTSTGLVALLIAAVLLLIGLVAALKRTGPR